jgi:hypothetical protein
MRFEEDRMRLKPDLNGNYDVRFDRLGNTIVIDPGNTSYPEPPVFVNGLPPQLLPVPKGQAKRDLAIYGNSQPTAYYRQQQSSSLRAIEMKQETTTEYQPYTPKEGYEAGGISEPEGEISQIVEAGEISESEISQEIVRRIQEGESKTATLKALGINGKSYNDVAQFYDRLYLQTIGQPYRRGPKPSRVE